MKTLSMNAVAQHAPLVNLSQYVEKMVCVTTGHIPLHTAEALGQDQGKSGEPALWNDISYVFFHEYGWIVHVSEDAASTVKQAHPELANLIELCIKQGIAYLRLDSDGLHVDGLQAFEW